MGEVVRMSMERHQNAVVSTIVRSRWYIQGMRKFFPIVLAVSAMGCAGSFDYPPPSSLTPLATVQQSNTIVSHDAWSMIIPDDWTYDDKPVPVGDLIQVFEARSAREYGRTNIRASLMIVKLKVDGTTDDEQATTFAQVTAQLSHGFFDGSNVLSQSMINLNERPASLTALELKRGMGIAIVGTAKDDTGYIITCGGDIMLAKEEVGDACINIIQAFRLK